MAYKMSGEIRYFVSEILEPRVVHSFFTRRGGTSSGPWSSLNLGGTVGDDPECVVVNRWRALQAVGREPGSIYDVWQVHGVNVAIADSPRPPQSGLQQADAILTDVPGVTLMMRFADCVPILLHDPVRKVVGIVHAGWMGTVQKAVQATIETMRSRYRSRPQDVLAAIGPSIGPDHYEIGLDVVAQVEAAFGQDAGSLLEYKEQGVYLDLWSANALLLEQSGVMKIDIARVCTACHLDDWYSHRAEQGRTGRFGVVIGLQG